MTSVTFAEAGDGTGDPVTRRDDQPGANAATRLLDTAAALFRERGYASSTTRELADRLGLKKASLYHYIDGKEDLLYRICMKSMAAIHEQVRIIAQATAPERRIRAMIEQHVASALENRDMHVVMLIELRSLSAPRLAEVVERRDAYEALLREAIVFDQLNGRIRTDRDAKYLTLGLLNLLSLTIFWYDPEGGLTSEELGGFFADMFLDGARPRPEPSIATPAAHGQQHLNTAI